MIGVMKNKISSEPTRRAILKTGTAAVASLSVAPFAVAGTYVAPQWQASRKVVLQFDVTPEMMRS